MMQRRIDPRKLVSPYKLVSTIFYTRIPATAVIFNTVVSLLPGFYYALLFFQPHSGAFPSVYFLQHPASVLCTEKTCHLCCANFLFPSLTVRHGCLIGREVGGLVVGAVVIPVNSCAPSPTPVCHDYSHLVKPPGFSLTPYDFGNVAVWPLLWQGRLLWCHGGSHVVKGKRTWKWEAGNERIWLIVLSRRKSFYLQGPPSYHLIFDPQGPHPVCLALRIVFLARLKETQLKWSFC